MRSFQIYVLHFIQLSDLGNGLTACRQQTIIRIHNIQVKGPTYVSTAMNGSTQI